MCPSISKLCRYNNPFGANYQFIYRYFSKWYYKTHQLLCTVGPYYKYRTYHDMIHNERAHLVPTLRPMMMRLKSVPFIAVGFLLASHYFSIQVCMCLAAGGYHAVKSFIILEGKYTNITTRPNKKSGQLTIADCCALILKVTQGHWLIQSKTYIHDFQWVINWDLSSISHHLQDMVPRIWKPPHPILRPQIKGPLVYRHQT